MSSGDDAGVACARDKRKCEVTILIVVNLVISWSQLFIDIT